MDVTLYVPILIEATKFVFDEVSKWIEHAREKSSENTDQDIRDTEQVIDETAMTLTKEDFTLLEKNSDELVASINAQLAETNAYTVKGLVEQIQIHRRNLVDHEKVEAEYGVLTPQHIKRAIEREASAIIEKSIRLKGLLEQIYGRKIEYE
jgi:hypothetical protein